jgi:hypothetical protein
LVGRSSSTNGFSQEGRANGDDCPRSFGDIPLIALHNLLVGMELEVTPTDKEGNCNAALKREDLLHAIESCRGDA